MSVMAPRIDLRRASVGLMVPLLGCGAEPPETARATQAIVGGAVTTSHPAVVRVESSGLRCTGTLVAPRVVLTAKHCVQSPRAAGPDAPWAFSVRVRAAGDGGREAETSVGVVRVRTTPGAYAQADTALAELAGADVATLTLADAPNVTPRALGAAPRPGDAVTAAGYGLDARGEGGVLRAATTRVRAVSGDVASTDPVTCDGDSGGPLLDDAGAVVGVLSGAVGACGAGESRYTLTRAAASLVAEARCESEGDCASRGDAAVARDDLGSRAPSADCAVSPAHTAHRGWTFLLGVAIARRRRRTTRASRSAARGRATGQITTGGLG